MRLERWPLKVAGCREEPATLAEDLEVTVAITNALVSGAKCIRHVDHR
jgi:hypothetical protein